MYAINRWGNFTWSFHVEPMENEKHTHTSAVWLSSTFQVFYIFAIGIPGISHLVFREWIFGFAACKAFLSLKTISSGVCINVTGKYKK